MKDNSRRAQSKFVSENFVMLSETKCFHFFTKQNYLISCFHEEMSNIAECLLSVNGSGIYQRSIPRFSGYRYAYAIIHVGIYKVIFPLLAIEGAITNVFTIVLLLSSSSNRKSKIAKLMLLISFCDLGAIASIGSLSIGCHLKSSYPYLYKFLYIKILTVFLPAFLRCSLIVICIFSFDRFIAIKFPLFHRIHDHQSHISLSCWVGCVFTVVYYMLIYNRYEIIECIDTKRNLTLYEAITSTNLFWNAKNFRITSTIMEILLRFIPLCLTVGSSMVIFFDLRVGLDSHLSLNRFSTRMLSMDSYCSSSKHNRTHYQRSPEMSTQVNKCCSNQHSKIMKSSQLLLTVSFITIVTLLPGAIGSICAKYIPILAYDSQNQYLRRIISSLCMLLETLNCSLNFFIYIWRCTWFRKLTVNSINGFFRF